jgi:hypothetical protein
MMISFLTTCVFFFSGAIPQDNRPSPSTLIEKARILAEEKGDPKKALLLLLDKVICRNDLSKAQFDQVVKMIAIFNGWKPSQKGVHPSAQRSNPDLEEWIQKEIEAYLQGKGNPQNILWFGKEAFPPLLAILKSKYLKPGLAGKIVPLLFGLDPEQSASFLKKVRMKGLVRFREIIAQSLSPQYLFAKKNSSVPVLAKELLEWIPLTQGPDRTLKRFGQFFSPNQILSFLEHPSPSLSESKVLQVFISTRELHALPNPKAFLEGVRKTLRGEKKERFWRLRFRSLIPWVLAQQGGFEVALEAFSVPEKIWKQKSWKREWMESPFFPKEEEGIQGFYSFLSHHPNSFPAWASLVTCLKDVWKKPFEEISLPLQKTLLQLVGLLKKNANYHPWDQVSERVLSHLLSRIRLASPEYQFKVWTKALGVRLPIRFSQGGPEILLFQERRDGRYLFPGRLTLDQRIKIFLQAFEQGQEVNRNLVESLFQGKKWRSSFFCSSKTKNGFFEGLLAKKALLKKTLRKHGSSWLALLPKKRAREVFSQLWEDPEIDVHSLREIFWEEFQKDPHPKEFFQWALKKNPHLPHSFLSSLSYAGLKKRCAPVVLDWIESTDTSWIHESWASYFPKVLVPLYSPRAKRILGRFLGSRNEKARKNAAQVLDLWKRLENLKTSEEDSKLRNQLWAIVHGTQPIPARIVALEGLFDLRDKRAWLVLSQWVGSENEQLRRAATALSQRRKQ